MASTRPPGADAAGSGSSLTGKPLRRGGRVKARKAGRKAAKRKGRR